LEEPGRRIGTTRVGDFQLELGSLRIGGTEKRTAHLPGRVLEASRSGRQQVSLEHLPATWGRAKLAGTTFPTSGYVVVSDGAAFVLVRATGSLRALQGQTVMLAGDTHGLIVARADRDRRIGS